MTTEEASTAVRELQAAADKGQLQDWSYRKLRKSLNNLHEAKEVLLRPNAVVQWYDILHQKVVTAKDAKRTERRSNWAIWISGLSLLASVAFGVWNHNSESQSPPEAPTLQTSLPTPTPNVSP